MSEYFAKINWTRKENELFTDNNFSREHSWYFDGEITVPASSSPHVVPLPLSVSAAVDPEEAFVASLASCHMLFFLYIAAQKKLVVDKYIDNAFGVMEKNSDGKLVMSKVTLRPEIIFSGEPQPTLGQIKKIHHESHDKCFIANSVKTEVVTEIVA